MLKCVFYTHIHIVIHNLTYKDFNKKLKFVRNRRIELLSHPWQGRILPLNQFRFVFKPPCAPTRTRTQNSGSEDRCDIHFTIGAFNFTQKVLYFKYEQ